MLGIVGSPGYNLGVCKGHGSSRVECVCVCLNMHTCTHAHICVLRLKKLHKNNGPDETRIELKIKRFGSLSLISCKMLDKSRSLSVPQFSFYKMELDK